MPRKPPRREAEKLGAKTLLVQCDVSDEAAVRAMLATVGEAFGQLDALVNNAGTTAKWKVRRTSRAWISTSGTARSPSTCAACSRSRALPCRC